MKLLRITQVTGGGNKSNTIQLLVIVFQSISVQSNSLSNKGMDNFQEGIAKTIKGKSVS